MSRLRVLLVALLLSLNSGGFARAAGAEDRAFEKAKTSFALDLWENADAEFASFADRYPKSERLAEAALFQAQARFKLRRFDGVVTLLESRRTISGARADEFNYWIAQSLFQSGQFARAAESFGNLAREFPNSKRRLEAAVGEAAARAKLGDRRAVVNLLTQEDGAFRMAAKSGGGEFFLRGILLLAETQLTEGRFAEAEAALDEVKSRSPDAMLEWRRGQLLCRAQSGQGRLEEAWMGSSNLVTAAMAAGLAEQAGESVVFGADVLEKMGRRPDAAQLLRRNLSTNAPVARQREAAERIASLYVADGKLAEACEALEDYLGRFTNAPAADVVLLTLGELYLKRHVAGGGTNLLSRAADAFDKFGASFPSSPLRGKMELNRGWCRWIADDFAGARTSFAEASRLLSSSESLAVARFKLGDSQLMLKNPAEALKEYRAALEEAALWQRAKEALTVPALYQTLRASLELTNFAVATEALNSIFSAKPKSTEAGAGFLLVTQGLIVSGESSAASDLLRRYLEMFPESDLRPQLELLSARAAERAGDWDAARKAYSTWLERHGTNALRAEVMFHQAAATARAGDETNAFNLFTNLAAAFPSNQFAPLALWWVADHHSRQGSGHLVEAEQGYALLAQTWPGSELALQARMMAGRMAMLRPDYVNAIEHFTNLTMNPVCPPELRVQALAAYGAALMRQATMQTNGVALLENAVGVFAQIRADNPGTEREAQAWGEAGRCYMQMAVGDATYYTNAIQAFEAAVDSPAARLSVKSEYRVGLAGVYERMAEAMSGEARKSLLKSARNQYAATVEENVAANGDRDVFWLRKASLDGGRVSETLEDWAAAGRFYSLLCEAFPQARAAYQRKIDHARAQQSLAEQKLRTVD